MLLFDPMTNMPRESPAFAVKAQLICDNLYSQLDEEHLRRTGRVTKVFHFRSAKNRKLFRWVQDVHGNRFFTRKAVSESLRLMFRAHKLQLPEVPGLSFKAWIEQESKLLQELLQKARRSLAMDDDETQVVQDCREFVDE